MKSVHACGIRSVPCHAASPLRTRNEYSPHCRSTATTRLRPRQNNVGCMVSELPNNLGDAKRGETQGILLSFSASMVLVGEWTQTVPEAHLVHIQVRSCNGHCNANILHSYTCASSRSQRLNEFNESHKPHLDRAFETARVPFLKNHGSRHTEYTSNRYVQRRSSHYLRELASRNNSVESEVKAVCGTPYSYRRQRPPSERSSPFISCSG